MATQAVKVKNEGVQGGGKPVIRPGFLAEIVTWVQEKWLNLRRFLHDVRVETRQVTWPTVADVQSTTAVVIVTVFFFGVYLFLVDFGVSHLVERVLKFFKP